MTPLPPYFYLYTGLGICRYQSKECLPVRQGPRKQYETKQNKNQNDKRSIQLTACYETQNGKIKMSMSSFHGISKYIS